MEEMTTWFRRNSLGCWRQNFKSLAGHSMSWLSGVLATLLMRKTGLTGTWPTRPSWHSWTTFSWVSGKHNCQEMKPKYSKTQVVKEPQEFRSQKSEVRKEWYRGMRGRREKIRKIPPTKSAPAHLECWQFPPTNSSWR